MLIENIKAIVQKIKPQAKYLKIENGLKACTDILCKEKIARPIYGYY